MEQTNRIQVKASEVRVGDVVDGGELDGFAVTTVCVGDNVARLKPDPRLDKWNEEQFYLFEAQKIIGREESPRAYHIRRMPFWLFANRSITVRRSFYDGPLGESYDAHTEGGKDNSHVSDSNEGEGEG